ncbi:methyltransferase [Rudanella paleaurantiibacter]|uniref:tRNA1(Val) (adenine(37)-N6)-methyltransferase n=1 Tax=Rudanella paleaurantiibacter TaxID=2614655 RepID=A0A7J5U1P4_9BACT|nr:methyltransferase [Rudanella paleaurantiibacter]KAB7731471.1 methyltransferase [Rudanella paleaurantiibacter]
MFRFKQFTIQQHQTAMKVCTDACVLGAYTHPGTTHVQPAPTLLDIGTGTGLLALMAAQNYPTAHRIDAVELDPDAFGQATDNVAASPFANRVRVHQTAIQDFRPGYQYDLILSNPPFFTNHLRSPDAATNRALHTETLPFTDLVAAANRLLHPEGEWWVLLPPYEAGQLETLAQQANLWPFSRLSLRHNARKAPFRHITGYRRNPTSLHTDTLTVYESDPANPGRETYTRPFRQLLSPFYLIF